jgi:hypothetical protein
MIVIFSGSIVTYTKNFIFTLQHNIPVDAHSYTTGLVIGINYYQLILLLIEPMTTINLYKHFNNNINLKL